jgi:hypothetical protein
LCVLDKVGLAWLSGKIKFRNYVQAKLNMVFPEAIPKARKAKANAHRVSDGRLLPKN